MVQAIVIAVIVVAFFLLFLATIISARISKGRSPLRRFGCGGRHHGRARCGVDRGADDTAFRVRECFR